MSRLVWMGACVCVVWCDVGFSSVCLLAGGGDCGELVMVVGRVGGEYIFGSGWLSCFLSADDGTQA